MAERPKLHKIGAEMQRWCALLEEELSTWPEVSSRPMFGMIGYYRGRTIFAAIPRTHAAGDSYSVLIKLPESKRHQLTTPRGGPGAGWVTFELHEEGDITAVIVQLGRAYEVAGKQARKR